MLTLLSLLVLLKTPTWSDMLTLVLCENGTCSRGLTTGHYLICQAHPHRSGSLWLWRWAALSNTLKESLFEKLRQLQCHFTWVPQKDNTDFRDLKLRLQDSINLGVKYQATSYNHLAFVNCQQGDYEEAIQNLKEAEKIWRENHKDEFERSSIITYGNFAWVHYHMGQLTEAQSYLDKLEMICKPLSDGPRYTAMIPQVYGEKGWSLLTFGTSVYYEEAKKCFEKALQDDSDNVEWTMGYATALLRLEVISGVPEDQERSQPVKYLRRVLELDPDDTVAMVMLALKLQEFKETEKANELVENALRKTPDLPYVLRYAAKFYRIGGDVDRAIGLLQRALEFTPCSSFLHHQIGICYRGKLFSLKKKTGSNYPDRSAFQQKAELISKCKYHFEKAFDLKSSFTIAKLDFAGICLENGEADRAEEIYKSLLSLEDVAPDHKQALALEVGLFELYHKRSESNAIIYLLDGLKIHPGSKTWKFCDTNLRKILRTQIERNPRNSKAFGVLGLVHQLAGEKAEAIKCFERALEFDPDNEEYLTALSELCLSM
ncbi:interferon-induced protein with tetratricopeptide repeats 5-like isoform X3 [Hypanus sabinus]|uniref:interferon-induced protein with tetratricopeptide repeats 5-like isoform X3 n=1 Tax=Hypanus sabinus TaxID=79690 RepID=UPI0028C40329|nr:interferon-induced protein with tetratricopeptide repeats 5-like isoform X3 [Hypanus sabinus]